MTKALFKAGFGSIEVLSLPSDEKHRNESLDYRVPQDAFMGIQVWNIDELFKKYKAIGVSFKQEIVDQSWGHRGFSILGPNGVVLLFIQDQLNT